MIDKHIIKERKQKERKQKERKTERNTHSIGVTS